MKHLIYISVVLLSACSEIGVNEKTETSNPAEKKLETLADIKTEKLSGNKIIDRKGYVVKVVPAMQFLQSKGETVAVEDKKALEKEIVVLLEIETPDPGKDFFDSPQVTFSKEDGMQYLIGNIAQDVTLFQGKNEYHPSGSSYEKGVGQQNKIRVLFFFSGIDINKKMRISYYDRIMDTGIINFGINNN